MSFMLRNVIHRILHKLLVFYLVNLWEWNIMNLLCDMIKISRASNGNIVTKVNPLLHLSHNSNKYYKVG